MVSTTRRKAINSSTLPDLGVKIRRAADGERRVTRKEFVLTDDGAGGAEFVSEGHSFRAAASPHFPHVAGAEGHEQIARL